jgi:hypothetical protein
MVSSIAMKKKSPATPPGIDPATHRLVAPCLNHYATPKHPRLNYNIEMCLKVILHSINVGQGSEQRWVFVATCVYGREVKTAGPGERL